MRAYPNPLYSYFSWFVGRIRITDEEIRCHRLAELNVIEQCRNIFKTGVVQRKRLRTASQSNGVRVYPGVHPFVFDRRTGELERIPHDFTAEEQWYRSYRVQDPFS